MKKNNKTITLNAQMTISKTESGMDLIQVVPDNPRNGLVTPFSGKGHAQLQSNASFDFVRRKRIRCKPELKLLHSSISFGRDGFARFTFVLPMEELAKFSKYLSRESRQAADHMVKKGYCR